MLKTINYNEREQIVENKLKCLGWECIQNIGDTEVSSIWENPRFKNRIGIDYNCKIVYIKTN